MSQTSQLNPTQSVLLTTFFVRGGLCALDASGVQEVIRLGPLTTVPHSPREVLGIVNLRGRIVTLLDVGLTLGLGAAEPGPEARIFIIEDKGEFIGLLVDQAGEVVEVEADRLGPPPANVPPAQGRFFKGVYRVGGKVITLIDVERVLGDCTD